MENWEQLNDTLIRFKVDGGYLYKTSDVNGTSMVWSPDIDLTRYQSHLRDAYNKGYQDGQEHAKYGLTQE